MIKILVVEDENKALALVKAYLLHEGYDVYCAQNGIEALDIFNKKMIDLIILDLMLPDIMGEDICKEIRKTSQVPIIILTAKSNEDDRVINLLNGADDYLVKPFSPRELVARVKVILRRCGISNNEYILFNDGLSINTKEMIVKKETEVINLTAIESKLLLFFINNPNQTFSREQLIERVLGLDFAGFDRTIDAHIKNLRQKIESNSKEPKYIKTIYGLGYRFEGKRI